jgi:hypothetical protein
LYFSEEPSSSKCPVVFYGSGRQIQNGCNFFNGQSAEVAELTTLARLGFSASKLLSASCRAITSLECSLEIASPASSSTRSRPTLILLRRARKAISPDQKTIRRCVKSEKLRLEPSPISLLLQRLALRLALPLPLRKAGPLPEGQKLGTSGLAKTVPRKRSID